MVINKQVDSILKWRCLGSTEQCYWLLYAITRAFQVTRVIEIGTHQGASAITFCQAITDNKQKPFVVTIDNWIGFPGNETTYNLREKAYQNLKESGFDRYIGKITGDSKSVLPGIFYTMGRFDLAFIDGCHEIDAIIEDYNLCKENVNLIIFHDSGFGNTEYIHTAEIEGWKSTTFPTRYIEDGSNHLVGLTLLYH